MIMYDNKGQKVKEQMLNLQSVNGRSYWSQRILYCANKWNQRTKYIKTKIM